MPTLSCSTNAIWPQPSACSDRGEDPGGQGRARILRTTLLPGSAAVDPRRRAVSADQDSIQMTAMPTVIGRIWRMTGSRPFHSKSTGRLRRRSSSAFSKGCRPTYSAPKACCGSKAATSDTCFIWWAKGSRWMKPAGRPRRQPAGADRPQLDFDRLRDQLEACAATANTD